MSDFDCDVVVIGAGLVGSAVTYDLRQAGARVVVLERESGAGLGVSCSNSGVLHTGFDSTPGSFETQMIRDQAGRWPGVFQDLNVPFQVPGALLLAHSDDEVSRLDAIAQTAGLNGVETRLLNRAELQREEPHSHAMAALLIPKEAITDPYEVVTRLLRGSELRARWAVADVEPLAGGVQVRGPAGQVKARFAVNCAGLFADEVAGGEFGITPRRGEFVVYPAGSAALARHILLPVPNAFTKGVLVFPTLSGHLCAGPTAVDQQDKRDWAPDAALLAGLERQAAAVLPVLQGQRAVNAWAGLRTVGQPHNFICRFSSRVPRMLHLAGIRSTGLSSCLGLSAWALGQLVARGLPLHGAPPPATVPLAAQPSVPWWERLNRQRRAKPAGPP